MLKKYGKYIIGFILIVVGVAVLGIIVYNLLIHVNEKVSIAMFVDTYLFVLECYKCNLCCI